MKKSPGGLFAFLIVVSAHMTCTFVCFTQSHMTDVCVCVCARLSVSECASHI